VNRSKKSDLSFNGAWLVVFPISAWFFEHLPPSSLKTGVELIERGKELLFLCNRLLKTLL
jgi:hypothetical protein